MMKPSPLHHPQTGAPHRPPAAPATRRRGRHGPAARTSAGAALLALCLTACGGDSRSIAPANVGVSAPEPGGATAAIVPVAASWQYDLTPHAIPNSEGGPWMHIDITNPKTNYQAIYDGTQPQGQNPMPLPAMRIVHAYVCLADPTQLTAYAKCGASGEGTTQPLGAALLQSLDQALTTIGNARLKVILRFIYNFGVSNNGSSDPAQPNDADEATMRSHIAQLAPIVAAHKDIVYAMQAGFIGKWGEWHNSSQNNAANDTVTVHNAVLAAVSQAFASNVNLEVRYPYLLLDYQPQTAPSELPFGIHNDAFASVLCRDGSKCDEGTYNARGAYTQAALYAAARQAASTHTFSAEPVTPEGAASAAQASDAVAQQSSDMQLSTINASFDPNSWRAWVKAGYATTLLDSVGPHPVLYGAALQVASDGRTVSLTLDAGNRGWGRIPHPRETWLVLTDASGNVSSYPLSSVSPAQWAPGSRQTVQAALTLPTPLAAGQYTAALKFPATSASSLASQSYDWLPLESQGVFDAATGLNRLGQFNVKPAS
ncbi:DUF4874 domain-containing protein [Chitinasiproducens palmae]|uniref:DUF4832 domain-containing protein n=1 Tax=Chitinasiproducens palmae TaxID=1770053 RepID=A0A1H2PNR5_9BURK|nr:DUF4874 domain-containing protein [Chitinasiproducens palmae]SDV48300.1 protein of unknown function [Chitinasiproducens palmae]